MGLLWSLSLSVLFLLLSSLLSSTLTNCLPSVHHPTHECHEDESHALLQFKESFVISKYASYSTSCYPKTASWMVGTDCCLWDGVDCDEVTGHVIGIDLSSSQLCGSMDANSSLFSLVHLQSLDLSDNDFKHSQIPARIGELSKLVYLNLSLFDETTFSGEVPHEVSHLPNLLSLDLRSYIENPPLHPINQLQLNISTLTSLIQNSTRLEELRLNFVTISSYIPDILTNLTYLEKLCLKCCELHGEFPIDMFLKLKSLTFLSLSGNKLSLLTGKSFSNVTLPPIQALALRSCNLNSEIPSWIMNLTNLAHLDLDDNKLQGEIPHSLFGLENLATLSLSSNLLQGQLEFEMFLKLKMLTFLSLSYNYNLTLLTGKVSPNAILSRLQGLDLGACNLVEFPTLFRDLDELGYLDMSNNDLKSIPSWMWRKRSLQALSIYNSSLRGEISPLICNLKSLVYLDLSYNNLSGMIPSCLGTFSQSLQILMLQGNKLAGRIPSKIIKGSALKMVDFSDNNLHGQLPRTFVNCRMLEFLDVSHNQMNDSFPFWLGTLPELKVIALHNNEFYGAIMCPERCKFPKLHIIDLSHNKFSGNLLPDIRKSWKSMAMSNISQLEYKDNSIHFKGKTWFRYAAYAFTMSNKGVDLNYEELQQFYNLIAIDLSCNKISGEIPDIMGDLKGLILLDLSNNILTGSIPSSLKKLSELETLDLSHNNLSGKIPQELTELSFLEVFNVSFNNLTGPIPENKQFSTFSSNSFEENQGLCGIQLLKKCEDHVRPLPPESIGDQDSDSVPFFEFDWKIILIGYGGGLAVGLALGSTFSPNILGLLKRIFKGQIPCPKKVRNQVLGHRRRVRAV